MNSRWLAVAAALSGFAAGSGSVAAQSPQAWPVIPGFTSLWPRGAKAGSTVEIELTGSRLGDPRGVLAVTTDRIRCTGIRPAEPKVDSRGRRRDEPDSRAIATLEIAADCPSGLHGIRVQTAGGLSELRLFAVGTLPEIMEAEDRDATADSNGTPATAEPVTLPCTVNGHLAQLPAGMESDCFRFNLRQGELCTAELAAARLASQEREDGFEASLSITGPNGETIASAAATSFLLTDPFVSFVAPADGQYTVTVAAALPPEGNRRVPWRLSLAAARRPTAVYPPGGRPGESLTVSLAGLPAGADTAAKVTLPETPGDFTFFADPHAVTPNLLRVLPGPSFAEQEPNDEVENATVVPDGTALPLALHGIIAVPGDSDVFRFTAKKDARFHIRVFSQALGSPADLRISIARKSGGSTERSDDAGEEALGLIDTGTIREKLDPALTWKAPADGEYFLTITDSRRLGAPDFVYRIECTTPDQALLTSLAYPDNNARTARSTISLGKGNRLLATVTTRPAPGAEPEGTWELVAEGLPEGVRMLADPFPASVRRIPVVFEASGDAAVTAARVRLLARPKDGQIPAGADFRQTIPLLLQGNDPLTQVVQPCLALAVTEALPFSLEVSAPSAALARDGELELEISLKRAEGFTQPIDVFLEQPPRGVVGQQGVTLKDSDARATFRLSARSDAPAGSHRISLTARNREGDNRSGAGRMWTASPQVPLEVSDPWLRVKFARARIEQGQRTPITGTIEKLRGLPGQTSAALLRLPRGVSLVSPVSISESGTVAFTIESAPDALVGSYSGIACELTTNVNGQTLKQIAGYASLRIDPARVAP